MTKESVFIDAQNGGIGVYIGAGNKVGFAKTAKTLKYILDTKKVNVFEDDIFFTSSMDFAMKKVSQTKMVQKKIVCKRMQDEIIANGG